VLYYNCQEDRGKSQTSLKRENEKKLKKPLDNKHLMCYTIIVKGREELTRVHTPREKRENFLKEILKNPLTNHLKGAIINT
jgi:hypothetical protein